MTVSIHLSAIPCYCQAEGFIGKQSADDNVQEQVAAWRQHDLLRIDHYLPSATPATGRGELDAGR